MRLMSSTGGDTVRVVNRATNSRRSKRGNCLMTQFLLAETRGARWLVQDSKALLNVNWAVPRTDDCDCVVIANPKSPRSEVKLCVAQKFREDGRIPTKFKGRGIYYRPSKKALASQSRIEFALCWIRSRLKWVHYVSLQRLEKVAEATVMESSGNKVCWCENKLECAGKRE